MSISKDLARFATADQSDLPSDVMAILRLSMLDWMACGIAGIDEPVSCITRGMAQEEGGKPQASTFGGPKMPARAAALVNGTTSHALDYDDTHFAHIGHPSVAVFSAALAAAEREGADGQTLQTAALIGMEASIRVGMWLGRGHYQIGFHQTATAGAFGAALASARIMGLEESAMMSVLGLTATRAAGLKSQFGTMGKPYNAGIAAATGLEAALLVARGFDSFAQGLDGPQGFGDTHHGAADGAATKGLGDTWQFATISHKFHACCHGLHAALEAVATLKVNPQDISDISVQTHPRWMTVCNQPAPDTGLGAKFSYATVLPMALLGQDTARLDSYTDALCARPDIQALRAKVNVTADDQLTEMQARVAITTAKGQQEAFYDLDAPMDLAEKTAKIDAKAASLLGNRSAAAATLVRDRAPAQEIGDFIRG